MPNENRNINLMKSQAARVGFLKSFFASVCTSLMIPQAALAEGTLQMGISQELVEWAPSETDRLVRIDILNAGEVINVVAGGGERDNQPHENDNIRFTILDENGVTLATHTTTGPGSIGKISPTDPMTGLITNAWKYTPATTGQYYLAVENTDANNDEIHRFDVTVTANNSIDPDPSGATGITGRVSSKHWRFRAGSFDPADATDANYFILTPGGFPNTDYVWTLDLNNFAGFGFSLRANSQGVIPPNSGFSVPFPVGSGNTGPNWVEEDFDIYLFRPVIARPEPAGPPTVQDFRFLDDEGVDNSISPDTSNTIQDAGVFSFRTDASEATYEIAIDINSNGQFGDSGDVRLVGNAVQGVNSVVWDGRDSNGNVVPYGNFTAQANVRLGEFHFVADDAETSGGNEDGLTVFKSLAGGGSEPTNVFWDDVTKLGAGAGGTNNLPEGGTSGTAAGYHTWGDFTEGPLGDKQFIDTWVYGLSSTGTTGVVVADNDDPVPVLATVDITPFSVPGDTLILSVNDADRAGLGTVSVDVVNLDNGETEAVTLTETGANTGVFTSTIVTEAGAGASDNSGTLESRPGDTIELRYNDTTTPSGPAELLTDSDEVLGISLLKSGILQDGGDGQADEGDVINYAFTVTNLSAVDITNVVVTDPKVTMNGGPLASLAVGANDSTTFTASYALTQSDIDAGQFDNIATVTANVSGFGQISSTSDDPANAANDDPDNDGVPNDPTVVNLPELASVTLLKAGTLDDGGDGRADVGDVINYVFTVQNTGNVTLTALTVTDPDATVSGGPIASLAPGDIDNTTYTGSYSLVQADIDAGEFTNTATVTGQTPTAATVSDISDDPAGSGGGPDDPTVTSFSQDPSVALLKEAVLETGPDGRADVGDVVNYSFTVTNTGNVPLENVRVTDALVTVTGGPIANLAVGGTDAATFTAQYALNQADIDNGGVTNIAVVTGETAGGTVVTDNSDDPVNPADVDPDADGNPDDPTETTLPKDARIELLKQASLDDGGDGEANVGDVINYTFTVSNIGNVTLTNVSITDPLITVNGGPIASLAPGASDAATFTGQYSLTQTDLDANRVENTATVTGNDPQGNPVTDISDDPLGAGGGPDDPTVTELGAMGRVDLQMEGVLDLGPDGVATAGDVINYVLTVTNTGPVTLTTLIVDDADLTILGGPLPSLNSGGVDNTTFTAVYTLTQDDIDNGEVTHRSDVRGQTPAGDTVVDISDDPADLTNTDLNGDSNPDDPTRVILPNDPALALFKTAVLNDGGDGWADVGDTIDYAFRLVNVGNVNLTNVTVADALVNVTGGPIAMLSPGQEDTTTFTASYVLTQADLENGSVTNTATSSASAPNGDVISAVSDDPADTAEADPDGDGQPSDPTVTPLPVSQPPVATNDMRNAAFNTPVTLDPRENDTDPENDPLTVTSFDPPADATVVINSDGSLTVTPNTDFVGVITVPYTVCDNRNNCDTAEITITIQDPMASLSGIVFLDENLDDLFDGSEAPRPNWVVELRAPDGSLVATTIADSLGQYEFNNIDIMAHAGAVSGNFTVISRHPETQVAYRILDMIVLTGGADIDNVNLPIEPMGVIYDSIDRIPVAGAIVTVATENGTPLPISCLRDASQQGQSTGSDGEYFFEIVPGADMSCPIAPTPYRINLTSPSGYRDGASAIVPSNADAIDPPAGTGPFPVVADFGAPNVNSDTNHYYTVTVGAGEREITRNNIPLDPMSVAQSPLMITKSAGVSTTSIGGIVPYTVTVTNAENYPYSGVDVVDIMPAGFRYLPDTLTVDGVSYTSLATPTGFTVENLTIAANQVLTLEFSAAVGTGAPIGISVNQVVVQSAVDGSELSGRAEASVRLLPTPEFDCSEVIGKVYEDRNQNGAQDLGEKGLAGVRLATVNGLLVNTDPEGRYHIACAAVPNGTIGSNFILKLDTRTLPTGYRMVSENPRVIRLTRGKMGKANFGVSQMRVAKFDVETAGFMNGRIELAPYIMAELPKLFYALRESQSVLRLTYHTQGYDPLAQTRLDALESYLKDRWKVEGCCYDLIIEQRLVSSAPNMMPAITPTQRPIWGGGR